MVTKAADDGDDKQRVNIRIQKDIVEVLAIIAKVRGVTFSKLVRKALYEFSLANLKDLSPEDIKNALDAYQRNTQQFNNRGSTSKDSSIINNGQGGTSTERDGGTKECPVAESPSSSTNAT